MAKNNFFTRNKTLVIVLAVVLILIFYSVGRYNAFITFEQDINGKWSEVENQYQRQADLIPNLVSVVSSAVSVETNFVKEIINARTVWLEASNELQKDTAGVKMNNGISALVSAVAESYPVLQANTQYIALTDELSGTQNRITVARGRYIESIQAYNIAIKRFPSNLLANIYGFEEKEYYQAEIDSLETPELGTGQLP
jgi:LemA protein